MENKGSVNPETLRLAMALQSLSEDKMRAFLAWAEKGETLAGPSEATTKAGELKEMEVEPAGETLTVAEAPETKEAAEETKEPEAHAAVEELKDLGSVEAEKGEPVAAETTETAAEEEETQTEEKDGEAEEPTSEASIQEESEHSHEATTEDEEWTESDLERAERRMKNRSEAESRPKLSEESQKMNEQLFGTLKTRAALMRSLWCGEHEDYSNSGRFRWRSSSKKPKRVISSSQKLKTAAVKNQRKGAPKTLRPTSR
ncbi:hypothetical protein M569_04949 [Genlisea aurea]|uniref:Uncharacterized protein n=1 Tax=Genlisea aurea TaxID=192259 RepID=S8CRF6_9LAMI|nr:hypothetical protein M569_04949 [Genlisea aurea]